MRVCRNGWREEVLGKEWVRNCERPPPELSRALQPPTRDRYGLKPWELQYVTFSLGHTDDLADETEIAAAVEVARADWPQWSPPTLGCGVGVRDEGGHLGR